MSPENRIIHVAAERALGEQALRAAEELLRCELWNDAVSRAYYAAFHFARAALLTLGVEPATHTGVSAMLGLHLVRAGLLPPAVGKDLARLEQFRTEADYNRFFVFTPESATEEVQVAQRCCAVLAEFLDRSATA